jgi:hypothetical protein
MYEMRIQPLGKTKIIIKGLLVQVVRCKNSYKKETFSFFPFVPEKIQPKELGLPETKL